MGLTAFIDNKVIENCREIDTADHFNELDTV